MVKKGGFNRCSLLPSASMTYTASAPFIYRGIVNSIFGCFKYPNINSINEMLFVLLRLGVSDLYVTANLFTIDVEVNTQLLPIDIVEPEVHMDIGLPVDLTGVDCALQNYTVLRSRALQADLIV